MRAEFRQQPVGARGLSGCIDEPGERRGKLHGAILGLTRHLCHGLSLTLGLWRHSASEASMTEPLVIRRETHIAAPRATVFAFLTDPEKILSWMGTEAITEAHPGGLYLVKG